MTGLVRVSRVFAYTVLGRCDFFLGSSHWAVLCLFCCWYFTKVLAAADLPTAAVAGFADSAPNQRLADLPQGSGFSEKACSNNWQQGFWRRGHLPCCCDWTPGSSSRVGSSTAVPGRDTPQGRMSFVCVSWHAACNPRAAYIPGCMFTSLEAASWQFVV